MMDEKRRVSKVLILILILGDAPPPFPAIPLNFIFINFGDHRGATPLGRSSPRLFPAPAHVRWGRTAPDLCPIWVTATTFQPPQESRLAISISLYRDVCSSRRHFPVTKYPLVTVQAFCTLVALHATGLFPDETQDGKKSTYFLQSKFYLD